MNTMKKLMTITLASLSFSAAAFAAAFAAPASAPMMELAGFSGAVHYDAILTNDGKLTVTDTNTHAKLYSKQLNTALLNQFRGYAYSLGQESMELVQEHHQMVCMMMPFEGQTLSVATMIETAGSNVGGPLRVILTPQGCWTRDYTMPKEARDLTDAAILKALLLSLLNEGNVLPAPAYSFAN